MTVLVVAQAVVIALLLVLVIGLRRANQVILAKLAAAPTAAAAPRPAPDIAGADLGGNVVGVKAVSPGRSTLLAFLTTSCASCEVFWTKLNEPAGVEDLDPTRVIIVAHGAERAEHIAEVAPDGVPVVISTLAWERYEAPGSPWFIVVDGTSGLITGEAGATSWDELLGLVAVARGRLRPVAGAEAATDAG